MRGDLHGIQDAGRLDNQLAYQTSEAFARDLQAELRPAVTVYGGDGQAEVETPASQERGQALRAEMRSALLHDVRMAGGRLARGMF